MKRIPWKNQWLLGLSAVLALSGAIVSVTSARAVGGSAAPTPGLGELPLPALDRVVAKLAAEARARTLTTDTQAIR